MTGVDARGRVVAGHAGSRGAGTGRGAGTSAAARYERERVRHRRRRAEATVWVLVAMIAAGVAVVGHGSGASTRNVAGASVVAVLAATAAVGRRPGRDPERWWRGAEGERATAELLEGLPRRWSVLHDLRVPGSRANIDHLVIGPRGVWVVDSKAYRGVLRAGLRSVRVGDRRLDTGPAAWEADVAAEVLGVDVAPLVVVHGEGLPRRGRRCDGVRVVPAEGMLRRLRHQRVGPRLGPAARRRLYERALAELGGA